MDISTFSENYKIIESTRGPLAYVDVGEGPVVLFVHGVSVNSALWRHVIGHIQDRYRCIAVDLPLHGQSPSRSDHDYSLSTLASELNGLLDALKIQNVHLVGNDSGGAVSQVFAAKHGSKLQSLLLTNCDTRGNIPPPIFNRTVSLAREGKMAKSAIRWTGDLSLARSKFNIGAGYQDADYLTDEAIWHYLKPVMGNLEVAKEFEFFLGSALREDDLLDAEPKLKNLDVPTSIVWARNDSFFECKWADWLSNLIPTAQQPVFVDSAGLYFVDEFPEMFTPHLLTHLGQWAPSTKGNFSIEHGGN